VHPGPRSSRRPNVAIDDDAFANPNALTGRNASSTSPCDYCRTCLVLGPIGDTHCDTHCDSKDSIYFDLLENILSNVTPTTSVFIPPEAIVHAITMLTSRGKRHAFSLYQPAGSTHFGPDVQRGCRLLGSWRPATGQEVEYRSGGAQYHKHDGGEIRKIELQDL
jgi:hypothetical protein